jgi:hypothetical protein
MSFLTGTNTELIYASVAAGAAKASFTSEFQINDTATMGVQAHLPPDFWSPAQLAVGKAIRIVARGIFSVTGTPTWTFSVRGGAAGATSGAILLGSAALTAGSGVTNQIFEFEGDVVLKTIGAAGANSTIVGVGSIQSSGTANKIDSLYAGGSTPGSVSTLDTSITNYINFNVACSANSASNSITLQQLLIFGLN